MSKNNSFSAGTGWSIERPFHEAKRGDVSTPYVTFDNVRKAFGVQIFLTSVFYVATDSDDRDLGMVGYLMARHTFIYDFGGSRSSIGLALAAVVTAFDRESFNNKSLLGRQRDYSSAHTHFMNTRLATN